MLKMVPSIRLSTADDPSVALQDGIIGFELFGDAVRVLNGGPAANALALADDLSAGRRAGLGVSAWAYRPGASGPARCVTRSADRVAPWDVRSGRFAKLK